VLDDCRRRVGARAGFPQAFLENGRPNRVRVDDQYFQRTMYQTEALRRRAGSGLCKKRAQQKRRLLRPTAPRSNTERAALPLDGAPRARA
jgi:hypothetical protein